MGDSNVTRFFRCITCARAFEMTEWCDKGNTACVCGGKKFFPARLTPLEVVRYLLTHPGVLFSTVHAYLHTRGIV